MDRRERGEGARTPAGRQSTSRPIACSRRQNNSASLSRSGGQAAPAGRKIALRESDGNRSNDGAAVVKCPSGLCQFLHEANPVPSHGDQGYRRIFVVGDRRDRPRVKGIGLVEQFYRRPAPAVLRIPCEEFDDNRVRLAVIVHVADRFIEGNTQAQPFVRRYFSLRRGVIKDGHCSIPETIIPLELHPPDDIHRLTVCLSPATLPRSTGRSLYYRSR